MGTRRQVGVGKVALGLCLIVAGVLTVGCGGGGQDGDSPAASVTSTSSVPMSSIGPIPPATWGTAPAVSGAPSTVTTGMEGGPPPGSGPQGEAWGSPSPEVSAAFAELIQQVPGLVLYMPTVLPSGTTLPSSWWPVSTGKSVTTWTGPRRPNPLILGEGADAEVRVVLQVGAGDRWLEILQRIKGDLGDISGEPAGTVAGRPATAYRYHGGDLIQWSDEGAWFAVYGANLGKGEALRAAQGMRRTAP